MLKDYKTIIKVKIVKNVLNLKFKTLEGDVSNVKRVRVSMSDHDEEIKSHYLVFRHDRWVRW